MRWMNGRTRLATVVLVVITAVVAGGCGGGGSGDKAGGSGEPVVLRMANAYGDLDVVPAVQDFVGRVKERSGGNLRIQVTSTWGDYADDAEQQVVRAVAAGKADLGWAGARVFDTMGVSSFQALQAPPHHRSSTSKPSTWKPRRWRPSAAILPSSTGRARKPSRSWACQRTSSSGRPSTGPPTP
jgi:hypothetical protein